MKALSLMAMATVKVFVNKQTNKLTDIQVKNSMSLDLSMWGHKKRKKNLKLEKCHCNIPHYS